MLLAVRKNVTFVFDSANTGSPSESCDGLASSKLRLKAARFPVGHGDRPDALVGAALWARTDAAAPVATARAIQNRDVMSGSRPIQPQRPDAVQWRWTSDPAQNVDGGALRNEEGSMAKRNKALAKLKKAEARAVEDLALARAKAARKIAKVEAALAAVERKVQTRLEKVRSKSNTTRKANAVRRSNRRRSR